MSNEVAIKNDLAARTGLASNGPSFSTFSLTPKDLGEAMRFADIMAKSTLVPKDYIDKPGNILVAIQKGFEIGLSPMNALESIAVINGRCTLWGDGMLALVQASPAYEWHDESQSTAQKGVCVIKRKGHPEHRSEFTLDDARRAGLIDKPGPWKQYTSRMLMLRARGFALRDKFADALKGMITAEEAMDLPPKEPLDVLAQPASPTEPMTLKEKLKEKAAPGGDGPPENRTPDSDVSPPASEGSGPPHTSTITIQDLTFKMRNCESIKEWSDVENAAMAIKDQGACTPAEWATYQGASMQKKTQLNPPKKK